MVNELINEVNSSLDSENVMAGLALALTLPDICAKAIYPTLTNKKRYIKWFDEYIGQYEHDEDDAKVGMPYLNGEFAYSLRCSVIHQGNPNVDGEKLGLFYFELQYSKDDTNSMTGGFSEAQIIKDELGNDVAIYKKISINV